LVAPAWEQARIAADLVTGADPEARYTGHTAAVRLKAADVDVTVVGDTTPDPWTEEPGLRVVQFLEPGSGRYLKAVVRDGTVVGASVVGDPRAAADLRLLVERGAPAPARSATLLLPGTRVDPDDAGSRAGDPTAIPDRTTICRCNGVTKGALVKAWTAGARGPSGLARATRATTGCGTCAEAVSGIAAWLATCDPDEPDSGAATTPPLGGPRPDARSVAAGGTATETSIPAATGGPR
jgi:assimilatory nitrate reductase electron transfer subunit